ncbi:aldo/keto reductase (plasmid) [Alloyangia pacifica]|uniref:Aldo/keto reductase n=1 Tax=Alloyangia pacifica TaxID=311180 RepID=A0A2U8HNU8_9RHOB|nr:aldo/keto reductase [Alloyangia pacifica]AWI86646.1 aldo/keto reductase [Alloyangia pacifica]
MPDTRLSAGKSPALPRVDLAPGLNIARLVCGLWQVADLEKDGSTLDPVKAADRLQAYAAAGFDSFDMADHYGSAEVITGELTSRPGMAHVTAFTKWCPEPGPMTPEIVRAGIQDRLDRLRTKRIDLLQFHWWSFEDPRWLDALREIEALRAEGLIGAIGVTNFDAAHLEVALAEGIEIVSNQVSFSLVDRRAAGALTALCKRWGVKLLAYGTLCGGFISEKWLGKPEPRDIPDWSRMKYKRFIDVAGGWEIFQELLAAAHEIGQKHGVSLSNVASRWVLDTPSVAATIIGARITEAEHRADNLQVFGFSLDAEDHAKLGAVFARMTMVPGDCGDEYRKPPFLTASGDLSHHLSELPPVHPALADAALADRARVFTGSKWEPIAGYCRAVKVGNRILVSGTTATHGDSHNVAPGNAGAQTTYILDKIVAALRAHGAGPEHVVRTRVYLVDAEDCEAVSVAHGRFFADHPPANTLLQVAQLIGPYRVEIEAEAILPA